MAVGTWPYRRLFSSWCLQFPNSLGVYSGGSRSGFNLPKTGAFKGFNFFLEVTNSRQITNLIKSGESRHNLYESKFLHGSLWSCGECASFISFMRYFWLLTASGFVRGMAFQGWILRFSRIISFSSSMLQVVWKHNARFFS